MSYNIDLCIAPILRLEQVPKKDIFLQKQTYTKRHSGCVTCGHAMPPESYTNSPLFKDNGYIWYPVIMFLCVEIGVRLQK